MRSFGIVIIEPDIKLHLQFLDCSEYLLPEDRFVELIENRLVEPFADAVGLHMSSFRSCMLDMVQLKIELVRMFVKATTELGAAIRQNTQDINPLLFKKRHHSIIEGISRRQRHFGRVELGKDYR